MRVTEGKMPKAQRLIRNSFLELLQQKSFQDLRVKDIIEHADISRNTFYLYYSDKYEVLEEIQNELINGFIALMLEIRQDGREHFYEEIEQKNSLAYKKYFEYIKKHSRAFSVMFNPSSDTNFADRFTYAIETTRQETTKIWDVNVPVLNTPLREYRNSALAAIYVNIFSNWLKRGMDFDEEYMGKLLSRIWHALLFI